MNLLTTEKRDIERNLFFPPSSNKQLVGSDKHNTRDIHYRPKTKSSCFSPAFLTTRRPAPRGFECFFCVFQSIDKVFLSLPRPPKSKNLCFPGFFLECRSCFFPRLGWLVHIRLTSNFTAKKKRKKRKEGVKRENVERLSGRTWSWHSYVFVCYVCMYVWVRCCLVLTGKLCVFFFFLYIHNPQPRRSPRFWASLVDRDFLSFFEVVLDLPFVSFVSFASLTFLLGEGGRGGRGVYLHARRCANLCRGYGVSGGGGWGGFFWTK